MVLLYKTSRFEGTPVSSSEGEVFWMELDEMMNAPLAEGMKESLTVFLNDDVSEEFFFQKNGQWNSILK